MNKALTNQPAKLKLAAILSTAFAVSFMVFLFTPLDLYLHNPTGFVISWKLMLPPMFIFALAGFIALSALLLLLCYRKTILVVTLLVLSTLFVAYVRFVMYLFLSMYLFFFVIIALALILWVATIKLFKEKAVDAVLLFIWGIIVISYAQMLFLNNDMSMLTGDIAGYSVLTPRNLGNLLLWMIVALLPLCFWIACKVKNKEFEYEKALIFTMLLISGMQISGLVSTAVSTELPAGYEDNPKYLSYEPTLNFNVDNNICVFLLDRLDVKYMTEVLEEYPELNEQLDGFTYYTNNISEYGSTFPSVATMLTQHYYSDGLTFSEYWEEAWAQHSVIDMLREEGFTTNLLIDQLSTYGKAETIQDKTDNLREAEEGLKIDFRSMFNAAGRLSLGRLSPYLLKNIFLAGILPSFGNKLFRLKAGPDAQDPGIGVQSDLDFYEYITENEFSANNDKKVFNFIHLNCAHTDLDKTVTAHGYHYDEENDRIMEGGNYIDTTRACFEMLNIYFTKMKKLGVYDNSTIILLGDHGGIFDGSAAITVGLLIKPKDTTGALKTDNSSELSNKYFGASVLEAAGLSYDQFGISYFDIIGGSPPPIRKYYSHSGWWSARSGAETITMYGVYEISGDANDFTNWKYHTL